jgi:rod shape-determining protein MreB
VDTNEVAAVLSEMIEEIAEMVKATLETIPPEPVRHIIETGIALCGGSSLLRGLDAYLSEAVGIRFYRISDPASAVALGAERLFKEPDLMRVVLDGSRCMRR